MKTAMFVGVDKTIIDGRRVRAFSDDVNYLSINPDLKDTYFIT